MQFEIFRALPHTDNGDQRVLDGGAGLRSDHLVGLTMISASFRVPRDDVLALESAQKSSGNIAGVRTFVMHREILRTQGEGQAIGVNQRLDRAQVGKGREYSNFHLVGLIICVFQRPREFLDKGNRLQMIQVHFPVTSNKRSS